MREAKQKSKHMKRFLEFKVSKRLDSSPYSLRTIDENRFATGDEDGCVKVWDIRQQEPIFFVHQMQDYVSDIITNEAQRYLVCSSGEGVLTTINLIQQRMHIQSEEYKEELTGLALIRNERKLLVSSSKGRFYVFNWGEFGYHSDEYPGPKFSINCMLSLTENIVATGSDDGKLRATHMFPHQQLGIVGHHDCSVDYMDISHDGELLASATHEHGVKFWNIKYLEKIKVSDKKKDTEKKKMLNHNLPSSQHKTPGDFFKEMGQ